MKQSLGYDKNYFDEKRRLEITFLHILVSGSVLSKRSQIGYFTFNKITNLPTKFILHINRILAKKLAKKQRQKRIDQKHWQSKNWLLS